MGNNKSRTKKLNPGVGLPGGSSALSGSRSLSFSCSREITCPECGGDGFFEHVQASHFGRHGEPIDYEVNISVLNKMNTPLIIFLYQKTASEKKLYCG